MNGPIAAAQRGSRLHVTTRNQPFIFTFGDPWKVRRND
jgi:hypothetical protein